VNCGKKRSKMAKGGNFEREVSKDLSLWWSNGERDDIFWHTGGSGSRFTSRRKQNKDTAYQGGDITFTDPIGEPLIKMFSIELKTGYGSKRKSKAQRRKVITNWALMDFLDSNQGLPIFGEFWAQSLEDAELSGREPLLIFRRNMMKRCIALWLTTFEIIVGVNPKPSDINLLILSVDWGDVIVLPLEPFFEWTDGYLNNPIWLPKIRAKVKKRRNDGR
jgi:hypothetical protein